MSHELAEKTAGLASRVSNLAITHTDDDSRNLLEIQDRLADLSLAAIVRDLDEEAVAYQKAIKGLNDAIDFIGEADGQIANVAKAITLASKAADLAEKALTSAAKA